MTQWMLGPPQLVHEVGSLAELERLWERELAHHRLRVQSPRSFRRGQDLVVRIQMPGPFVDLAGTVVDVRSARDHYEVELQVEIPLAQRETLRRLSGA